MHLAPEGLGRQRRQLLPLVGFQQCFDVRIAFRDAVADQAVTEFGPLEFAFLERLDELTSNSMLFLCSSNGTCVVLLIVFTSREWRGYSTDQAIRPIALRNRASDSANRTLPMTVSARKGFQTTSIPALR